MECPRKPQQLADLDCRHSTICETDCPFRDASTGGRIQTIAQTVDRPFIKTLVARLDVPCE